MAKLSSAVWAAQAIAPIAVLAMPARIGGVFRRREPTLQERLEQAGVPMSDPRVRRAVELAQQALDQARLPNGKQKREQVSRRAQDLAQRASTEVEPTAREAAQRAREAAERLRIEGAARTSELSERLRTDVAPTARTIAQEALEEAEQILATARERAGEVSETVQREYVPRITTRLGEATGTVAGATAGVAQVVGKQIGQRRSELPQPRGGVRGTINQSAERAGAALGRAGRQTGHVLGQAGLIVTWSAALGAIVYYGLLRPEQRERVRAFLSGTVSQTMGVMQDFRTEPSEFPPSNLS